MDEHDFINHNILTLSSSTNTPVALRLFRLQWPLIKSKYNSGSLCNLENLVVVFISVEIMERMGLRILS